MVRCALSWWSFRGARGRGRRLRFVFIFCTVFKECFPTSGKLSSVAAAQILASSGSNASAVSMQVVHASSMPLLDPTPVADAVTAIGFLPDPGPGHQLCFDFVNRAVCSRLQKGEVCRYRHLPPHHPEVIADKIRQGKSPGVVTATGTMPNLMEGLVAAAGPILSASLPQQATAITAKSASSAPTIAIGSGAKLTSARKRSSSRSRSRSRSRSHSRSRSRSRSDDDDVRFSYRGRDRGIHQRRSAQRYRRSPLPYRRSPPPYRRSPAWYHDDRR